MLPENKKIELGSSNQEAFPPAGKNTAVVLVSCHAWKCVPTAISDGVDISEALGVICYNKFLVKITKITSRIGVSFTHSLPFYF